MQPPAISVRNLGKCYRLGVIGRQTLADEVRYWWHRMCGRDPRAHMGQVGHTATEARRVGAEESGETRFWALRGVSFDVPTGQVVGIIGRNGAGKSTLLKILTRITEPSEGEAFIHGRVASLLEVGTGFHPELTGRENVYMNGTILGMKRREIAAKFDEIVGFAELDKFIDTPVKRYSSGMYVRLAFAVAAHLDPEILLIDEVLAVGDVGFQKKCLGKMKDVAGAGRTILFVSHNMAAIKTLCQQCYLIDHGHVAEEGTPDHVVARYLDRNLLVGAVAMQQDIEPRMEGMVDQKRPNVRCRKVAITGLSGDPRRAFDSSEGIRVAVVFECLQVVRNLNIMVFIVDEDDQQILSTTNLDSAAANESYQRLDPGTYQASCVFPADTFGGRSFFLTVHLEVPKIEHIVINKILEFEVRFKGYNNIFTNSHVFIRPRLEWAFKKGGDGP